MRIEKKNKKGEREKGESLMVRRLTFIGCANGENIRSPGHQARDLRIYCHRLGLQASLFPRKPDTICGSRPGVFGETSTPVFTTNSQNAGATPGGFGQIQGVG